MSTSATPTPISAPRAVSGGQGRCCEADCLAPALRDSNRCGYHRLRWAPGSSVDAPAISPWVRRALSNELPAA